MVWFIIFTCLFLLSTLGFVFLFLFFLFFFSPLSLWRWWWWWWWWWWWSWWRPVKKRLKVIKCRQIIKKPSSLLSLHYQKNNLKKMNTAGSALLIQSTRKPWSLDCKYTNEDKTMYLHLDGYSTKLVSVNASYLSSFSTLKSNCENKKALVL